MSAAPTLTHFLVLLRASLPHVYSAAVLLCTPAVWGKKTSERHFVLFNNSSNTTNLGYGMILAFLCIYVRCKLVCEDLKNRFKQTKLNIFDSQDSCFVGFEPFFCLTFVKCFSIFNACCSDQAVWFCFHILFIHIFLPYWPLLPDKIFSCDLIHSRQQSKIKKQQQKKPQ